MRTNSTPNAHASRNWEDLGVDRFIYLSAEANKSGGSTNDMKYSIGLAMVAINKHSKIWGESYLGANRKYLDQILYRFCYKGQILTFCL
jgi:hypothetical protein